MSRRLRGERPWLELQGSGLGDASVGQVRIERGFFYRQKGVSLGFEIIFWSPSAATKLLCRTKMDLILIPGLLNDPMININCGSARCNVDS